jgi:hypothetical protein
VSEEAPTSLGHYREKEEMCRVGLDGLPMPVLLVCNWCSLKSCVISWAAQ